MGSAWRSTKPLLHLWSDQHNLTRRVLAITDQTDHRLALVVERFGRNKPDRLEFLRMEFAKSSRDLSGEEACARLARILSEQSSSCGLALRRVGGAVCAW